MASYRFKAVSAEGARLAGQVAAEGERQAARLLERRGLSVLALEPASAAAPRTGLRRGRRLKDRDIVLALHELATLLMAGVALAEAVAAQSRSDHHPLLLAAVEAVYTCLRHGQPFPPALSDTGL